MGRTWRKTPSLTLLVLATLAAYSQGTPSTQYDADKNLLRSITHTGDSHYLGSPTLQDSLISEAKRRSGVSMLRLRKNAESQDKRAMSMLRLRKSIEAEVPDKRTMSMLRLRKSGDEAVESPDKRAMSMMRLRRKFQQRITGAHGEPVSLFRLRRGPSMMRLRKRISQFRLKKAADPYDRECLWGRCVNQNDVE